MPTHVMWLLICMFVSDCSSREYGFDYVELQLKFEVNLFPIYPPSLRPIKPRLMGSMLSRLVGLAPIQVQSWNPARQIEHVLQGIFVLLRDHGQVEFGDGIDPFEPYSELEVTLLQLSSLSEVSMLATHMDAGSGCTAVDTLPSFFIRKEKTGPRAVEAAASTAVRWQAGTGYGSGHQQSIDFAQLALAQQKRTSLLVEVAQRIASLISTAISEGQITPMLVEIVRGSCLLPFLASYVATDSLIEMERHVDMYAVVFQLLEVLSRDVLLFTLVHLPLPSSVLPAVLASSSSASSSFPTTSTTLLHCFRGLRNRASSIERAMSQATDVACVPVVKKSKSPAAAAAAAAVAATAAAVTDDGAAFGQLLATISKLSVLIEQQASSVGPPPSDAMVTQAEAAAVTAPTTMVDAAAEVSYVQVMEPWRFAEVDDFLSHHFFKSDSYDKSVNRHQIRRLSQEYGDLARTLPIHRDSSVFLRVKSSALNYAQMLIVAPDGSPYSRCDIHVCVLF